MKAKTQARKSKRNYLIIALVVILLLLAVGYASFTQTLNLSGNIAGSSTWDVKFLSGSTTDKDGASVAGSVSTDGHSLTVDVSDLQYPGDAREVTAVIKNNSSMPIKLTGFTSTAPEDATNITFNCINLNNETCELAAGASCTYTFNVGWNEESKATNISGQYSFTFTYTQNTTPSTVTTNHAH